MIQKVKSLWALMQAGKMVKDPALWKTRQITSSMLVGFIWAAIHALNGFGVEVPVDAETVDAVAVAVLAIVNVLLTVSTTEKIGLQPKPESKV